MANAQEFGQRATAWLSRDLAELADELKLGADNPEVGAHFDVVIVGSGYGGAMALHELAGYGSADGRPLRIALLERGNEYLPGAFPARMSDLAGHVRFATSGSGEVSGRREGLFDLRLGADVAMLLGNGLGGGSLINAGVMAAPLAAVFDESAWPRSIRDDPDFRCGEAWGEVRRMLGAREVRAGERRLRAMRSIARGADVLPAWATVAEDADDRRGVAPCNGCGDCATGCNFGAKRSLDVTLLADARDRHDPSQLRIVTGATVVGFALLKPREADNHAPQPEGFELAVEHTRRRLAERQPAPYLIRTRILILAAGTMGSTELLLRARRSGLKVSPCVGTRFSGNGDNIFTVYGMAAPSDAVADDSVAADQRRIGPTITSIIDRRENDGLVIEDLGIPGPLRRLMEETLTSADLLRRLVDFDRKTYRAAGGDADLAAIDRARVEASLAVALIGRDDADGCLRLPEHADAAAGTLAVDWPGWRSDLRLGAYQKALQGAQRQIDRGDDENDPHGDYPAVLANPIWRPLPDELERVLGPARGPMITVHPLGGCVMAESAEEGVVNEFGQVYRFGDAGCDRVAVYPNLVVLDGSIVPTSLGINPSLTIAMLARRAIQRLRDDWQLVPAGGRAAPMAPRPVARRPPFAPPAAADPAATQFELTEQMIADGSVALESKHQACRIELQLWTQPCPVSDFIYARSLRMLAIDPARSRLRLYRADPAPQPSLPISPEGDDSPPPAPLLLEVPLGGTMQLMRHAPSSRLQRTWRAMWASIFNRALRDLVRFVAAWLAGQRAKPTGGELRRVVSAWWRLLSWSGDRRLLEYTFDLGEPGPESDPGLAQAWKGAHIRATKTLTYGCGANPVNQLTQAKLVAAPPGLRIDGALKVDLPYFGRVGVPLLRLVAQADQPAALVDVGSLLAYLVRVLFPLHVLTLRLPDRPKPAETGGIGIAPGLDDECRRLPGELPGLGPPQRHELRMGPHAALRLTRYRQPGLKHLTPVLMIHGYSASGTTFAHPRLPEGGLAGYLARQGHDAWVLDMRSSAGMATAQRPWDFEQMGCQDIPLAVEQVLAKTGAIEVDIVAHCMGAAMLSLGLFGDWTGLPPASRPFDLYPRERAAMGRRIRRIVFSQVGPVVAMSPVNTARAWLFSWATQFFNFGHFEFRPRRPDRIDDMLDSLLCAVPYPAEDFGRENPLWPPWKRTPWVVTRHRMDALYGITFKLANVDDAVLDRIDDFFGPMNLQTVAQVIAFAREQQATDRAGHGGFIRRNLRGIRGCKVLCLHAAENGLADIATRDLLYRQLCRAEVRGESIRQAGIGHQDSLIGRDAKGTFETIAEFLQKAERA